MNRNELGYEVFEARDGSTEIYIGHARTLRGAHKLAAQHARGEISGTPANLYETARASGSRVEGCDHPDGHAAEPVAWFGRDGWYCACRALPEARDEWALGQR